MFNAKPCGELFATPYRKDFGAILQPPTCNTLPMSLQSSEGTETSRFRGCSVTQPLQPFQRRDVEPYPGHRETKGSDVGQIMIKTLCG